MKWTMWLLFAILSMLAYAAADLLGKRKVDAGTAWTTIELFVSSSALAFAAGIALFACGFGESGRAPWAVLAAEPLILVTTLCFGAFWLLGLVSFRYLGLSVSASVGGANGIVFFIGMLLVNMATGRLGAVREMLHPARIVPILVVLVGAFLLPRMEKTPVARRRTVVGMLILFLAIVLDGVDSLVTAAVFDAGRIGPVDFMIASWLALFPLASPLLVFLRVKEGRRIVPFQGGVGMVFYAVFAVSSTTTYLLASSHDAVRTGLVFVAAPIFTMIGARVFLKERYTLRQTVCVWTIAIAAVAFCIADRMI